MAPIRINGNELDPEADRPALRALGIDKDDSSKSNYILIQTKEPMSADQKSEITGAGAKILEYVSTNTYLCRWEPQALPDKSFITWANVYPEAFVVPARLKEKPTEQVRGLRALAPSFSSDIQREVDIVLHNDLQASNEVRASIAAVAHVKEDSIVSGKRKFRLKMEEQYLDSVAGLDEVYFVEEVLPNRTLNDRARVVMEADRVTINGVPYLGEGEVVAVGDTGFDSGDRRRCHPAFTGRVLNLYPLGRRNLSDDPNGHGTHVCGSVLGDGSIPSQGLRIQGTAPGAQLVVQSVFTGHDTAGNAMLDGIPMDLNDLFKDPYENDGARVHTNSWGLKDPSDYDQQAREIDEFAHDNPDMVILFAGGNDCVDLRPSDGVADLGQIGSQAFAKNCITVGASENNRRELAITYGDITSHFPRPPIVNDLYADNPDGMAAFSSRGNAPTRGARIRVKPDVVAPGTGILSARSRHLSMDSSIAQEISRFGVAPDRDWLYLAGTSMATPLVAGCCAVLRESLIRDPRTHQRRPGITPSSALIKALLINGAVDLPGQYPRSEAGRSPNPSSGWGRVNLANSIIVPGPNNPNAGFGEGDPLPEGGSRTIHIRIPGGVPSPGSQHPVSGSHSGTRTFKITLVWTDKPSPPTAVGDQVLQNNLNLIVRISNRERHGNRDEGDMSFDEVNNVEQIVWENMPAGDAEVTIRAGHYVSGGMQAYAYAWKIL